MRRQRDEGNEMRLRPHHILCICNYTGRGYSKSFEENMSKIAAMLRDGGRFTAVSGADDVCAACPNNKGGTCETEEKVRRCDKAAAELLGVTPDAVYSFDELSAGAENLMSDETAHAAVCGDCEWFGLCREVINNRKIKIKK